MRVLCCRSYVLLGVWRVTPPRIRTDRKRAVAINSGNSTYEWGTSWNRRRPQGEFFCRSPYLFPFLVSYSYCTQLLYTVTVHSYRTQLPYTVTVHSYCTQLPYTVTVHSYRTQLLYTVTVHSYCTQLLYTVTVHSYCTQLLYTVTVHSLRLKHTFPFRGKTKTLSDFWLPPGSRW